MRIEVGVHLAGVAEELGFVARAIPMRVILNCLHCEGSCGGLRASAQVPSIVENKTLALAGFIERKCCRRSEPYFSTFMQRTFT